MAQYYKHTTASRRDLWIFSYTSSIYTEAHVFNYSSSVLRPGAAQIHLPSDQRGTWNAKAKECRILES